jgi:hypothetical protein
MECALKFPAVQGCLSGSPLPYQLRLRFGLAQLRMLGVAAQQHHFGPVFLVGDLDVCEHWRAAL